MARWDAADLLARCKRNSRLPALSEWPTDDDWYSWLTEAEAKWKSVFTLHAPGSMIMGPVKLQTFDGGLTYLFPRFGGVFWDRGHWNQVAWNQEPPQAVPAPIYFEAMARRNGDSLIPGAYWDTSADYVLENDRIRMCRGRPRRFPDGPWARLVPAPGEIAGPEIVDGVQRAPRESTIQPAAWRIILVYDALERFATAGGKGDMQDPDYWRGKIQKELFGDKDVPGDLGILGRAKMQDGLGGMVGRTDSPYEGRRRWWQPA